MGVYGRCDPCSHRTGPAARAPAMELQSPPICQRVQHEPAGKRPHEDTRWRPSRASAPHRKSRPAASRLAATESGDQEGDGRPDTRRGQATQRRQMVIRTKCARRGHLSRISLSTYPIRVGGAWVTPGPASSEVTDLPFGTPALVQALDDRSPNRSHFARA